MQKTFVRKKSESLLIENEKAKAVTLATFFDLKIRLKRIAFMLLLECNGNPTTEKAKAKKMLHWLFSCRQRKFNEQQRLAISSDTEQSAFHEVKCGSEHLDENEIIRTHRSPTKNPDCLFSVGK